MNQEFKELEEKVRSYGYENFQIRDQEHFGKMMEAVKRVNY